MLSSSTHDTKRSEDVRARIDLLSELPTAWSDAVTRWSGLNQRHKTESLPDPNAEYLFYQTLVGAWPISTQRVTAYMEKAAREAKVHTAWTRPDGVYEAALHRFVESAMADAQFIGDVAQFVSPLIELGRVNSLSQLLLKLTAPGVPDVYQGTELWDLSLVDPDNRRPVDFERRRHLLKDLSGLTPEQVLARSEDGLPKLLLLQRTLHLRRSVPHLFAPDATYEPLQATGQKTAHVIAFARAGAAITIVPRLVLGLANNWQDTTLDLPDGPWRNQLTGDSYDGGPTSLQTLLHGFPVALLTRP